MTRSVEEQMADIERRMKQLRARKQAEKQAESVASRAPAHADVERVGGVGEVPCLLHVGFGLFFGLFAFVFGQPLVKPCLEPVGERLFRPDGLRGFLRGLWRRFTSLRAFLWPFGRFRA